MFLFVSVVLGGFAWEVFVRGRSGFRLSEGRFGFVNFDFFGDRCFCCFIGSLL